MEHWFYPFLFSNGLLAACLSVCFIIAYASMMQEMRDPKYLDLAFNHLEQLALDREETQQANKEVLRELEWCIQLHSNYAFAAHRLQEVMEYWRSRQRSQDVEAMDTDRNDRWEQYILQLRKSLDDRKWALGVMAQAIRDTPHGAARYVNTHALYQNFIYLQQDISHFWNQGWGLEMEIRRKKMLQDKTRELKELIESTVGMVPEARSLMEYLKKPTQYKWTTTSASGFQIMHRRAPFSLEKWLRN